MEFLKSQYSKNGEFAKNCGGLNKKTTEINIYFTLLVFVMCLWSVGRLSDLRALSNPSTLLGGCSFSTLMQPFI